MDLTNDNLSCGHCFRPIGDINNIIQHDLCAKHPCFINHDNIEVDAGSKMVYIKRPPELKLEKKTSSPLYNVPRINSSLQECDKTKSTYSNYCVSGGSISQGKTVQRKAIHSTMKLSQNYVQPLKAIDTVNKQSCSKNLVDTSAISFQSNVRGTDNPEHNWSDADVKSLIDTYITCKESFSSPLYNKKTVWEKISSHLSKMGIIKSGNKCDEKWRNLKKTYEKILYEKNKTGNNRVDWKFFDDFHSIYFKDPHYNPIATASSQGIVRYRENQPHVGAYCKTETTTNLSPGETKRKRTICSYEVEQNKQRRHEDRMKLKREIFEWYKKKNDNGKED